MLGCKFAREETEVPNCRKVRRRTKYKRMIKYQTLLGKIWDECIPNASMAVSRVLEIIEDMCNSNGVSVTIDETEIVSDETLKKFESKMFKIIQSKNTDTFKTIEDVHKKFVELYNEVPFDKIQQMAEHEKRKA